MFKKIASVAILLAGMTVAAWGQSAPPTQNDTFIPTFGGPASVPSTVLTSYFSVDPATGGILIQGLDGSPQVLFGNTLGATAAIGLQGVAANGAPVFYCFDRVNSANSVSCGFNAQHAGGYDWSNGNGHLGGLIDAGLGIGRFGAGLGAPDAAIYGNANSGGAAPAATTGTVGHFVGNGGNAFLELDGVGGTPIVMTRAAGGTLAAPTFVTLGMQLGQFGAGGLTSIGYTTSTRGKIAFTAAENWTSASNGTEACIYTTPTGSTTSVCRLRADSQGNVSVNNGTTQISSVAGLLSTLVSTPATSSATCTSGQFSFDAAFAYFCVATNTWRRVATVSF